MLSSDTAFFRREFACRDVEPRVGGIHVVEIACRRHEDAGVAANVFLNGGKQTLKLMVETQIFVLQLDAAVVVRRISVGCCGVCDVEHVDRGAFAKSHVVQAIDGHRGYFLVDESRTLEFLYAVAVLERVFERIERAVERNVGIFVDVHARTPGQRVEA